jgi:hypothetical protein
MASFGQDLVTAGVGSLIGGLIAFGIALFTLHRERERSSLERREQFIVDACWDLVDRSWKAVRTAELAIEAGRTWDAYRAFDDLSVQMWGQAPTYRYAGIDDFAQSVRKAANYVLASVFVQTGRESAGPSTHEMMLAERNIRVAAGADADELASIDGEIAKADAVSSAQAKASQRVKADEIDRLRDTLRSEFGNRLSKHQPGDSLEGFAYPRPA